MLWQLGRLAVAVLLGLLTVGAAVLYGEARAHDAPAGWSYPADCCSGVDCREVSAKAISERSDGYRIEATGRRE